MALMVNCEYRRIENALRSECIDNLLKQDFSFGLVVNANLKRNVVETHFKIIIILIVWIL